MRCDLPALLIGVPGLLLASVAAGCAGNSPGDSAPGGPPDQLWGTSWLLEDIGGAGVIDYAQATLEFPEAGKVADRGSCNRFFGSVQVTGRSIAVGPLGTTRMAGAEAVMNQETKYLKALQSAERYELDGAFLLVHAKGMERPLRFTRHRP
jgi:heat shock protein HslJ